MTAYKIGDRVWRARRDRRNRRIEWESGYVVAVRNREGRVIVRSYGYERAVPLWDVRRWTNVGHSHGYPRDLVTL